MITFLISILILILILMISDRTNFVRVKNGRVYEVVDLPNQQVAAKYMNKLDSNARELINHLVRIGDKYAPMLVERYNPQNLIEVSPINTDSTSYTINKGQVLALCLRNEHMPRWVFYDINTLTFVLIHELAHLSINEHQHIPKFWNAFRHLLFVAAEIGIYVPINYQQFPREYCGLQITSNPTYQ